MTVVDVVLPTLAVIVTWLCVAAVLAGSGFLVRRTLLRGCSPSAPPHPVAADLWVGLAAVAAYLELWSLAFPIGWSAWLVPLAAAGAGLRTAVTGLRRPRRPRSSGRFPVAAALVALGALWLANQALGPAASYDLGLYHLNVIRYADRYAAIPGLALLQTRLGAADPHLLLAAFLDHGPWSGAGLHLVNGLLATMLLADIGLRFAGARGDRPRPPFTTRMAVLAAAATVITLATSPQHWVAAPDLDAGAFVVVLAGMLYLAEFVERDGAVQAGLTATAALALAAATRPQYSLFALAAIGIVVVSERRLRARVLGLACVLPAAIAVGSVARQAVLSGYPLFPLPAGGLPVDWRVPAATLGSQNRADEAWARWPGVDSHVVLASWRWLTAYWLPKREHDLLVLLPLSLLGTVAPSLVRRGPRDAARRSRLRPLLAVLIPSVATLAVWFLLAPDPRFALAPIWLTPIALTAWALPPAPRLSPAGLRSLAWVAAGVLALGGAVAGLVLLGVDRPRLLVPGAIGGWAYVAVLAVLLRLRRVTGVIAYLAVLSIVLAAVGITARLGAFHPVVANQPGPFGSSVEPVPAVTPFTTASGLHLVEPADTDQCWATLLCTPSPDPALRLRGGSLGSGFTLSAR